MTAEQQHHFRNSVCCIFAISRLLDTMELPERASKLIKSIQAEAVWAGQSSEMDRQKECSKELLAEYVTI